jgi:hypothetical protein
MPAISAAYRGHGPLLQHIISERYFDNHYKNDHIRNSRDTFYGKALHILILKRHNNQYLQEFCGDFFSES